MHNEMAFKGTMHEQNLFLFQLQEVETRQTSWNPLSNIFHKKNTELTGNTVESLLFQYGFEADNYSLRILHTIFHEYKNNTIF